jgi:small-conductance mechanosensitive channel
MMLPFATAINTAKETEISNLSAFFDGLVSGTTSAQSTYNTLWHLTLACLILASAFILTRFFRPIEGWLRGKDHTAAQIVLEAIPLLMVFIWILAVALAGATVIRSTGDWQVLSWTLGVVVLLISLRHVLSQILAGALIVLQRRLKIGETIRVGEIRGTVERIGLQAILIKDPQGVIHNLPPMSLFTSIITHEDRPGARPIEMAVSVPMGIDPYRAARLVYEVAAMSPYADARVRPEVAISLDDGYPTLMLRARATALQHERRFQSQVGVRITREFTLMCAPEESESA